MNLMPHAIYFQMSILSYPYSGNVHVNVYTLDQENLAVIQTPVLKKKSEFNMPGYID